MITRPVKVVIALIADATLAAMIGNFVSKTSQPLQMSSYTVFTVPSAVNGL